MISFDELYKDEKFVLGACISVSRVDLLYIINDFRQKVIELSEHGLTLKLVYEGVDCVKYKVIER